MSGLNGHLGFISDESFTIVSVKISTHDFFEKIILHFSLNHKFVFVEMFSDNHRITMPNINSISFFLFQVDEKNKDKNVK